MKPADAPHESHLWKRLCLVLPVVALVVLLYGLGSRPFLDYDEAIYARVMDDTARSGQSVTLISDGAAFYDKPPLYFWLGMAARGMFGSAEFAYRLPSALAGVVCVVLVMLIAFEINRRYRTAWIAGVVLLTTPLIFDAARQVRIDVLLTAGILFSFYAFLKGLKKPAWFLGVGVGMAVGLLTKNVVGLFSVFPILVWAFVHRQYAWLRAPYFWMSMALFLVLAAPWHVVETYLYGRTFWDNYLVFHVLERFASNVNGGSARGPGYYVHFLATFAFPWIWISAICAAALYRIRRDARSYVQPVLAIGGSVCALAGIFFVAESKLLHYMIPALAFLAVFIALSYESLYAALPRRRDLLNMLLIGAVLLGIAGTAYVGSRSVRDLWIEDTLAENEYQIGTMIRNSSDDLPVFTFQYPYLDTIRYYSGKTLQQMSDGAELGDPFFLVIRTELYVRDPFPAELASHLTVLYQGQATTLLKFTP